MLEKLKKDVYEANMKLVEYDLVKFTWGNVSGYDKRTRYMVIKPSGVPYEELNPDMMVVMNLNGEIIEGNLNPSSDAPTHIELYKRFPNIGGVTHAHSVSATAFAQANKEIEILGTTHADVFYGNIPCTRALTADEVEDEYERNTGIVIAEAFKHRDYETIPAVLVSGHGPFSWGTSAKQSVYNMAVLEEVAKMAKDTYVINPEQNRLNQYTADKHYFRKHGKNAYYGQCKKGIFDELLCDKNDCACGREHKVMIKKIIFEKGAVNRLSDIIGEYSCGKKVVAICDDNTYLATYNGCDGLCDFDDMIRLDPDNLHANEIAIEKVKEQLTDDTGLLVALGSGTIHDVTRYIAYKMNIDFISVPTAPSVDGYVSNVAALTINNAKKTVPAVVPVAMVADINIIAAAPWRLIVSGFGDLIGKYTSLFDWRISNILLGEDMCEYIIGLEEKALEKLINNIDGLKSRDEQAIADLFYGLVLSGLAMQMYGNSRPASGSEHHISHFIEMEAANGFVDAYHGEKVGVGFNYVTRMLEKFAELSDFELIDKYEYNTDEIHNIFNALSGEIDKENASDCLEGVRISVFKEKLEDIKLLIKNMPKAEDVDRMFESLGAPKTFSNIGLDEGLKNTILKYSPYVRNRLTLMRCLHLLNEKTFDVLLEI